MTILTNTTDRKALVKAIAEELHTEARYLRTPTYAYEIGDFTVDRYGNIIGDDFTPLMAFLLRKCGPPGPFAEQSGEASRATFPEQSAKARHTAFAEQSGEVWPPRPPGGFRKAKRERGRRALSHWKV